MLETYLELTPERRQVQKHKISNFCWAVFEIWTMWFLDRVLGGPQKNSLENVKSNLNASLFSSLLAI